MEEADVDTMIEQDANIQKNTQIQSAIETGFQPYLIKNDKRAKIFIWIVSIIVFVAVAVLSKLKF